jgi:CDP-glycerol glycerophosphotransferase (TagB/SpsB family)
MEAFNCNHNQVLICGQPRNDDLFVDNDKNVKETYNLTDYKKIILWLPTVRFSTRIKLNNQLEKNKYELSFPIINDNRKMYDLNNKLMLHNMVLLIKPHPMQDLTDSDKRQYSNIKVLQQKDLDSERISLYKLLKVSDALITDYSSVYFDYLLLNRPIGFTINDIKDYEKSRGFIVDNPLQIMPGEKILNYDDYIRFIEQIINEDDKYVKERLKINDLCNTYKDGNNSKRILDFCGITLE